MQCGAAGTIGAAGDLAGSDADLAETLTAMGNPTEAVEQARQGRSIFQELAAADPSNAIYSRNVALCDEKMADAFARSAADSGAPGAHRIEAWSDARGWYQKAEQIFVHLREHGTLTPTDADKPKELSARIVGCERAVEQLAGATGCAESRLRHRN
jgi:hypothetical protein